MTWTQVLFTEAFHRPQASAGTSGTRFCMRFLLTCIVLFLLLEMAPDSFYYPLNRLNAVLSSSLLTLMGLKPEVHGLFVVLEGFRAQVIGECSAVFLAVLPLAYVLAYPSDLASKVIGWSAGLSVLFAVNLIRITALVITGARSPAQFDIVHLYLGQTAMVVTVLIICLAWTRWSRSDLRTEKAMIVAVRCVLISTAAFGTWLLLSQPYARLLYRILQISLWPFHIDIRIPEEMLIYPDTFQSFNLVTFTALFWAFGSGHRRQRTIHWFSGIAILAAVHIVFKLAQICFFQLNQHHLMGAINALLVLNEWVLPFGLWLFFTRRQILEQTPQHRETVGDLQSQDIRE